jgi:hypothetical protein
MKLQTVVALVVVTALALALGLRLGKRALPDAARGVPMPATHDSPAEPKPSANAPAPGAGPAAQSGAQALREVQALVGQGKIGAARVLAEAYLERIPVGPEAAQIESLTGVHPHR